MKTYTKAVSATLASALAVGMVPAMALAADDAIELQASLQDDMAGASIASYENGLVSGHKFTYTGQPQGLVPETAIGCVSGITYDVASVEYWQAAASGTTLYLDKDTAVTATPIGTNRPTDVGVYYVRAGVDNGTNPDEAVAYVGKFEIIGKSMVGAEVYEVEGAPDLDNIKDDGIVWNGAAKVFASDGGNATLDDGELNIKVGDVKLGVGDYEITAIYDSTNTKVWPTVPASPMPSEAGTYKVVIKGLSAAFKDQTAELSYTIQKLNLGKAYLPDTFYNTNTQPLVGDVAIKDYTLTASDVVLSYSDTAAVNGKKVLTVVPVNTPDVLANIEGKAEIEYMNVTNDSVVPELWYDEEEISGSKLIEVGATKKKNFDASLFTVKNGTKELTASEYTLVVTKVTAAGEVPAKLEDLTSEATQAKYRVRAAINPEASTINYAYAGKSNDYLEVQVVNGEIGSASVAFTFGGKLKSADFAVPYNGDDQLDNLDVVVKTTAGAVVAEGDYELVITKTHDASGADIADVKVTEAIDAGKYNVVVKSSKYNVTDTGINITISPMVVSVKYLDYLGASADALYTGEELSPFEGFTTQVLQADGTYKTVEVEVPAEAYKFTITKFNAEKKADQPKKTPTVFKEAGTYKYTMADAKATDNYQVTPITSEVSFIVTAKSVFPDVPAGKWFSDEVAKISQYKVDGVAPMGGYKNGLFGPYDNMKRGDMALVLARMADLDAPTFTPEEGMTGGWFGPTVNTPFADVYGDEYYAWAVQAMAEAGIMGGYTDGSGCFGAQDTITREQVATVLYRYDALYGKDVVLLASGIDGYKDADEVSKYARVAMDWAVEKGFFGVDTEYLNPGDNITRAELAAVLVRYLESYNLI